MDHSSMSDYMAHGFCFSWEPGLVWLHVASDILNGVAYYVIAAAMGYYFYKRRDVPFIWVFLLFVLFIVACGTTHFFAAYTVYRPDYWTEGYVKAFTALISIIAAIVFIPKIPEAINMPSLTKTVDDVHRLNAELVHQSALLRSIIDSIPDLIFYKDTNSVYLGCNKAFERFAGRPEQDQVGKTDFDFFDREVAEFFRQKDCEMMEGGQARSNEELITYPDGHQVLLDTLKTPFWGPDGALLGLVGISRDITERKQVEEERKVMLQRQQGINLLQQSLIASAPLDSKLKSITDSVVRLFGADFCRIWLIRPGDLCEQGCIHADEHEEPHVCRYRDRCLHLLASSGRYTHTDGKVHRRVPFGCYKIGLVASGKEHKFICNDVQNDPRVHNREWARELGLESFAGYQLRVPDGETLGVLALFAKHKILADEDTLLDGLGSAVALVVQQSVAEEARKQKERELEEKNAEMERFTYTVSHDLKSPLVTISSFVGYLEMDIKTGDDTRIHDDIGFIRTAADKMGQMIAELLELSRVGRVIANPVQVSFQDVVQEALQLVAGRISERDVQVIALESPVMLYGDRSRLVEIWQNLVENAVKYMGNQKEPHIEIGLGMQEKTTIFFVRDNGMGLDPRYQENIFGLFNKLDATSEGSGLGLALVRRIVEMYGGQVWVESEGVGHGSCFKFTLPGAVKG